MRKYAIRRAVPDEMENYPPGYAGPSKPWYVQEIGCFEHPKRFTYGPDLEGAMLFDTIADAATAIWWDGAARTAIADGGSSYASPTTIVPVEREVTEVLREVEGDL